MNVIVSIPDDIAHRLIQADGDLSRSALEALALEAYKTGRLARSELRRMLGFETGEALDGFLKAHDVFADFMPADPELNRPDRRDASPDGVTRRHLAIRRFIGDVAALPIRDPRSPAEIMDDFGAL